MRLKDKVAIVTGGSVGIGAAIAKRYAAEGATVATVYKSNDEGAAGIIKEITDAGGKGKAFKSDVSDVAKIEQLIADDEGMLMRQERELADQQQQQLRARASESMRRDQKSALRQLETALQSLRAEELQRGERLKGEQAQLRERLEADYRVLKNAAELELSEDPFSEVEIEIREDLEPDNQIRDDLELLEREPSRDDVMRDRTETKQLREVQVLEQMKAELEVLQALNDRGGKNADGRTAEHKAMLEQAYKDLKRQLRPDDVVEESTDQDDDSESDDVPVDDDDDEDEDAEVELPILDLEIEVF